MRLWPDDLPVPVRAALFTLLLPGTVTVVLPSLILLAGFPAAPIGAWRYAGLAPLGTGIATYIACAASFARRGRGTPAPWDAPRRLVVGGLYRFVRNPMYVGIVLVLMGEAILAASPALAAYGAVVAVAFHLGTVLYEERILRATFGAAFDRYVREVPRWVPRVRPFRAEGDDR